MMGFSAQTKCAQTQAGDERGRWFEVFAVKGMVGSFLAKRAVKAECLLSFCR